MLQPMKGWHGYLRFRIALEATKHSLGETFRVSLATWNAAGRPPYISIRSEN